MPSSFQLWPVQARGAVVRPNFAGDPQIESIYHKAMEQGRVLESSISDANFLLAFRQRDLNEKIQHYFDLNKLAIDGQTKLKSRFFLYAADSVRFLETVKKYAGEINAVVGAVTQNLQHLQAMEASMLQMLTANVNSLSTLLSEICNWGLPNLPSIPNLLGLTAFRFDGFNFSTFLHPVLTFPKSFSFSQCQVRPPFSGELFVAPPILSQPVLTPPLDGTIAADPTQYTDPVFISTMQSTTSPVYKNTFSPNDMLGSLPDPSFIISNYSLPAATYAANILSAVPALVNLVQSAGTTVTAAMQANERSAFVRFVTLDEIVRSDYDVNLTAAWLLYLDAARRGRGGSWIPNFEKIYVADVKPSADYLAQSSVPWNNVLGGSGVTAGPQAIPLIAALKADTTDVLKWQLSYIEAALLGYTRSQTWESAANSTYLLGYTGADLDYVSTAFDAVQTVPIVVGQGTANFPVVMNIPKALVTVMTKVIAAGAKSISYDPQYRTTRPQFRFTFDQFAGATEVDYYTQYWRTFNYNFQQLLLQAVYAVGFVVNYEDTLDSAIDPLGNPADYNALLQDANTRNRSWTSGTPLLPIPFAPDIVVASSFVPDSTNNGWIGNDLDVAAYLSRPDIRQLPVPVQSAMLRTNVSYAALVKSTQAMQAEIQAQIQKAQNTISQATQAGFQVEGAVGTVPASGSLTLAFPNVDFDNFGNVTNQSTFTIQQAGQYILAGIISYGSGGPGSRQVQITVNGIVEFLSMTTDPADSGPVDIPYTAALNLNVGDVIQVQALSAIALPQPITAGDLLCLQVPVSDQTTPETAVGPPPSGAAAISTFVAGETLQVLTAVQVENGGVFKINPSVDITSSPPNPANAPRVDGVTLLGATVGNPITVATIYGGVYTAPADQGWTVGGLLYAGPDGLLTQDYVGIILPSCYWIVVVGRATASDAFIFEPNLPSSSVTNF